MTVFLDLPAAVMHKRAPACSKCRDVGELLRSIAQEDG